MENDKKGNIHDPDNLVKRLEHNLEYIQRAHEDKKQVYEVTQLVASISVMYFVLWETYCKDIENKFTNQMPHEVDWLKNIKTRSRSESGEIGLFEDNAAKLIAMLRHGFAHYNIQYASKDNTIVGIWIWNISLSKKKDVNFMAYLSIGDLEALMDGLGHLESEFAEKKSQKSGRYVAKQQEQVDEMKEDIAPNGIIG